MRSIKFTSLILGAFSLFSFSSYADDLSKGEIPIKVENPGTGKPGLPHRTNGAIVGWAVYDNGTLQFSAIDDDIDYFVTVVHSETGAMWSDIINCGNQSMMVGTISGSYTISITTSEEVRLAGFYTI